MTFTRTHTVHPAGIGPVDLEVTERGAGHPVLVLHGGAGPTSVDVFADRLAARRPARVLTPTHPGFGGTARPEGLRDAAGLAATYGALLEELQLDDVTVVGNSIGGWVAAELTLTGSPRIGGVVLVDAVGIEVPGHPVADVSALTTAQVAELSYADPDAFRLGVSTMSPGQLAALAGNRAAVAVYGGGPSMADPTLAGRLAAVTVPTLVLWGDSDRIVDPDYGRAYAEAVPGARFQLLPRAGHLPQVESPDQLVAAVWQFVEAAGAPSAHGPGQAGTPAG